MLEQDGALRVCPDRQAIETGAFDGNRLEIAWAASRVDVFFAHVQGCARLRFSRWQRQADQPMRPRAAIPSPESVDCLSIAVRSAPRRCPWLRSATGWPWMRKRADLLMRDNRSYIFFREADVEASGWVRSPGRPRPKGFFFFPPRLGGEGPPPRAFSCVDRPHPTVSGRRLCFGAHA